MARAQESNTYTGCLLPRAGLLVQIAIGNLPLGGTCPRQTVMVHWNQQGPKGDKGDKGDQGEQGPAGPAGPGGIVSQVCPVGQVVAGFDDGGNIVCVPRGRPLPPVLAGISGPFFDFAQRFCSDPCEDLLGFLNQLAGYEVSGMAEPGKTVTFYSNGNCSGTAKDAVDASLVPLCEAHLGRATCLTFVPLFLYLQPLYEARPSADGSFKATLATIGTGATVSVTTGGPAEERSDCEGPLTLP
jgi:hypothetical protein